MADKTTDMIVKIMKDPKKIRNIAICAHIDHGKTTFSDNLLAGAGMMSKEDAGKALKLDFHADEQERGITIDTSAVSMVHTFKEEAHLINLMDTPGHVDFGGDVTRAMRAVDGAIVLVDSVEGMMPQTETVLRQALRERVKPVLFINKVDRLIRELKLTPGAMQERFVKIITNVNAFINKICPEEFKGKWNVNVQDGSVSFGSAFHNWALSVPYMQEKKVTFKDIVDCYDSEDYNALLREKAPLHEVVLNMVIQHLPNPQQGQSYRIPKLWHGDLESAEGKGLMSCDPSGKMFFIITKVVVDPQAGEISAGRLFSGTLKKGTEVYLNMAKEKGRIQQVYVYNGAKKEIIDQASAGNIIGVSGVKGFPGETVTIEPTEPFEQMQHIFDPVVTVAIEAKKPSDLPKLIEVLRQVSKEDPTVKIEINEETGEHLLHGMGELHLEVIANRIKTEKNVDIKTSPPIVVYRETITKASDTFIGKSPNKHNHLFFKVEPLDEGVYQKIRDGEIPEMRFKKKDLELRDKFVACGWESKEADKVKDVYDGNVFVDATRGIVHMNEIMEMLLDMFEQTMREGPLAREPALKVKVSIVDAKLHEDAIHRGLSQMYPAVREGIKEAINNAGPVLLEPLQIISIDAPVEFMGDVSKLISNKRGQLLDMQQDDAMASIKAKVPVGDMFGWSGELRSSTGGRGTSSVVNQVFERLPGELQDKIVKQIRTRKGLGDNA